jgi:cytochrome c oxidase accessory protein FixG
MTPPLSDHRVLSTLNQDGSRHWIRPKLSRGRFLGRRRIVGYALIALFVALPLIEIGGRPAVLIDFVTRELSLFGMVFRPTDGVLLMLAGLAIVSAVFLATALFGRVWCGWGCPQSVYLELVFRPIERLLEGTPAQQAKLPRFDARRVAKWAIYVVLSIALANVFLAYFVGVEQLRHWVFGSPIDHPVGFSIVVGVSALMLADFAWFREQTCIVACPYGRLQSVMLDRHSLIVGYDTRRGEPRGRLRKKLPVVGQGDCVDCGACVATCPTGIDIRNGLQMECIGCAQCIDACDAVMDKLGRKRGLIGYTSKAILGGLPRRLLRARTVIYPALLVLAVGFLAWNLGDKPNTEVSVERITGPSFVELPDGTISSQGRIKLENTSDQPRHYKLSVAEPLGLPMRNPWQWDVGARKSVDVPLMIDVPRELFVDGKVDVYLKVIETGGYHRVVRLTLLGPVTAKGSAR